MHSDKNMRHTAFALKSDLIAPAVAAVGRLISVNPESNRGPFDLQSNALPTELSTGDMFEIFCGTTRPLPYALGIFT